MPAPIGAGRQTVFAPLDDGAGRPEAVVRRLGSAIALGLIADGEQLPAEAELATALGVSTVTLREALSDLRRRGLVETRRGRAGGSFVRLSEPALSALARNRVRELGSADLRELGEFHAAVAGTAARLAAERASTSEIDQLSTTLDRLEREPTTAGQGRVEGRFYIEVAAAAQSVRLTRQEIGLQSELAELPLFPPDAAAWASQMLDRHRSVVAAIGDRDGDLARRLTEDWITRRTSAMIKAHLTLTATPAASERGVPPEVGCAAVAESLVERIFGAVGVLRGQVLHQLSTAVSAQEPLQHKHFAQLRPGLLRLLAEHREIVVGMGMIVAPGLLPHERRRLEWWQYPPGRDQPSALQVDLNPESLGFYDYDTAEWFRVPRSTGRRHIVGPYVDAHGTDRYLLTFTAPVMADGIFLGVVGADVPVSRFERSLLAAWGPQQTDVVIVNDQGRVVVSNSAQARSGDLAPPAPAGQPGLGLPDVPWQIRLSAQIAPGGAG